MIGTATGASAHAVWSGLYPRISCMYCITTKKNPKLAKNRKVMPTEPVAKSGRVNSLTSRSGCLPSQFDNGEHERQRHAGRHASPDDGVRPAATGSFHNAEDEYRHGAADQDRAEPVHRSCGFVARRPNRAGAEEQCQTRCRERVEHGLPLEEVQQQPRAHEADDRSGTRNARPDANGLVALTLRERCGQQRQGGGHDECRADTCHRTRRR